MNERNVYLKCAVLTKIIDVRTVTYLDNLSNCLM